MAILPLLRCFFMEVDVEVTFYDQMESTYLTQVHTAAPDNNYNKCQKLL